MKICNNDYWKKLRKCQIFYLDIRPAFDDIGLRDVLKILSNTYDKADKEAESH